MVAGSKARMGQGIRTVHLSLLMSLLLICLTGAMGAQPAFSKEETNCIVRGLVLDNHGFPIPDAGITVFDGNTRVKSVAVDHSGWYGFSLVCQEERTHNLKASAEGFLSKQRDLAVKPGLNTGIDFFLQIVAFPKDPVTVSVRYTPEQLRGHVIDKLDRAVTTGWITLYESGGEGSWRRLSYVVLDKTGKFYFPDTPSGPYMVRAFIDGYPVSEELLIPSERSGNHSIVVVRKANTEQIEALRWLNWHRIQAGLKPVSLDHELNRQTQLHAEYHVSAQDDPLTEGLGAHFEYPGKPGFTNEGLIGGLSSNGTSGRIGPKKAIDGWINTLYHRLGPFNPSLRKTGFARLTTSWLSIRGTSPKSEFRVVRYPAHEQIRVPTEFSGAESPPPLPPNVPTPTGYVITLQFTGKPAPVVTDVKASVKNMRGRTIPVYLSWPERQANANFPQEGAICLIPKSPLNRNQQYIVEVSGKVEGKRFVDAWSFSTGNFVRTVDLSDLAPPELRPEIVLRALPRLTGRVTDLDGNPVTKGWVGLLKGNDQVGFSWLDPEDGSYETGIVSAGDYRVKVYPGIFHRAIEEEITLISGRTQKNYAVKPRHVDKKSLGVAFNKPVKASYAQMPHLGDFVVDGDSRDSHGMWIADPFGQILEMMNPPAYEKPDTSHWVEIDLEEPVEIDRMHIFLPWWGKVAQLFRISISPDRESWTIVAQSKESPMLPTSMGEAFQFEPTTARYVRLEILPISKNTGARVLELRVFQTDSHAIDGILDDTKSLHGIKQISDPSGDTSGPGSYDLKTLYGAFYKKSLVLATDHFKKGNNPRKLYHTIHIQAFNSMGKKTNYSIQGNYWSWVKIRKYADGVPYKDWEEVLTPGGFSWCMTGGGEWKIPRTLFGDAAFLKIRAIDAGYDASGKVQYNGDSSSWLSMDLSPVKIVANPQAGSPPLTVKFATRNTDSKITPHSYVWDFDGDGSADSNHKNATHVYSEPGLYTARLTVLDTHEREFVSTATISVGEEQEMDRIIVDGRLWDWEQIPRGKWRSFDDPKEDSSEGASGYDIKSISLYDRAGFLFVAAKYYNSVRDLGEAIHTFVIRTYGTKLHGLWIYLGPGWTTVKEIRNNEPWKQWPKLQIERTAFQESCCIHENGEWGIPISLLGNPTMVSVRYAVGIEKWDADSIASFKVKTSLAKEGKHYADGNLDDLLSLPHLTVVQDPDDDTKTENSFDIKTFYGAIEEGVLVLGADFYRTAEPPEKLQQTIHIQTFGEEKLNYWITSALSGWVNFYRYRDGTPFKEWDKLSIPAGFDWAVFPQGAEWRIPLDLFSDSDRIAVRYIAGGYDQSGKALWGDDTTQWIEFDQ